MKGVFENVIISTTQFTLPEKIGDDLSCSDI